MHQQERKDLQETFFFEQFITLVPALIHVAWRKDEAPDFIIQAGEKNIGVEVERVIKISKDVDKSMVLTDSIHEQIVDEAYKQFAKQSKLPFLLYCEFIDQSISKGREFDFVVNEIVAIALREAQYIDPYTDSMRKIYVDTLLSGYVKTISIHYFARIKRSCWYSQYYQMVPELTTSIIEDFIKRKESKSYVYREKCDEVWLLLVHENISGYNAGSFNTDYLKHEFPTSFDQVFMLHVANNTFDQLVLNRFKF